MSQQATDKSERFKSEYTRLLYSIKSGDTRYCIFPPRIARHSLDRETDQVSVEEDLKIMSAQRKHYYLFPLLLFTFLNCFCLCLAKDLEGDFNVITVAGHKTGSLFSMELLRGVRDIYKNEYSRFYEFNHMDDFLNMERRLQPYRAMQLTRCPLDRYISSHNYHKNAPEPWLTELRVGDLTYQGYINTLSDSDGILFAMASLSGKYNWEWQHPGGLVDMRENPEVLVVKLEHFRVAWKETLKEVADFWEISEESIYEAARNLNYISQAKTDHSSIDEQEAQMLIHKVFEFPNVLECRHYIYFERIAWGEEAMQGFGYESSLPHYRATKERACEGVEVTNIMFPDFPFVKDFNIK